jgi:hypothetical protein
MDYASYRGAVVFKDVPKLAKAWRPGYKFKASDSGAFMGMGETENEVAHEVEVAQSKGKKAEPKKRRKATEDPAPEEYDQSTKERLIESFFQPAFSHAECGPWARSPSFPFSVMKGAGKKAAKSA